MKPLCCIPLKPGLRLLSVIQMVVSAFLLFVSILSLIYYENHRENALDFLKDPPVYVDIFMNMRNVRPTNITVVLGYCVFHYAQLLILGLILLIATFADSKFLIRLYVLYKLAAIVFHALVYFTLLCFGMLSVWTIIIYVAGFIFQEWTMWASTKFLDQLVFGTADEQEDDCYDFSSRRSSENSGIENKFSYKL